MKKSVIILIIMIITYNCKTEEPRYSVPDKVVMVPKNPDTSAVEQGIDAVPDYDGIQIQWYRLFDRSIDYFTIYRKGEDDRYFKKIANRNIDFTQPSNLDTTFMDTIGVELYTDYSYYVTATNKDGKEGPPSDTVSYLLLQKVIIQYPKGQFNFEVTPEFVWNMDQEYKPDYYILRIKKEIGDWLFFVAFVQSNYTNEPEIVDLNSFAPLDLDDFEAGIIYYWRVDCFGDEFPIPSGSESGWELFSVSE